MADVVPGGAAAAHVDPDAQATVTDFIDYTEHLPSDVRRSLALIEKLNGLVRAAHGEVHALTRQWSARVDGAGASPERAAAALRARISYQKQLGRTYARASLAEARRVDQEIARHQNLLRITGEKLEALPPPPSRDPTPKPVVQSPQAARDKENAERVPKIKLRLDKNRLSAHTAGGGVPRPRHRRMLVVPGEVLPPPNPNSPTPSAFSEWESPSPAFSLSPPLLPPPKRKYKKHKVPAAVLAVGEDGEPKLFKKKKERAPRDPNKMGTNVHSAVAGISTSNALLLLTPPPTIPVPGTRHAPWMRLTDWEMAKLRKRMKKNAVWTPSDTMIRRELNDAGRGPENYMRAKKRADELGEELVDGDNVAAKSGMAELQPGEIPLGAKTKLTNKGMSLNAQKKQKKLLAQEEAKEQAREADEDGSTTNAADGPDRIKLRLKEPSKERSKDDERERKGQAKSSRRGSSNQTPEKAKQAARFRAETVESQLSMLGPQLRNLFTRPGEPDEGSPSSERIVLKNGTPKGTSKKRKRASSAAAAAAQLFEESQLHSQLHSEIVVTPTPSPAAGSKHSKKRKTSGTSEASAPVAATTTTTKVPLAPAASSPTKDGARAEPRRPSLVIKPPAPPSRRSSRTSTPAAAASGSRPQSRSSSRLSERASTEGDTRPRRQSATPANIAAPARLAGSRGKRPAPGPVTSSQEGGYAISIGRRPKKPSKKTAASRRGADKGAAEDEVNPNEERYCVCGDVSWGTMVACENEECENAWFHLECVGLADIPPRRTKWWCPDCATRLGKSKA